MKRGELVSICLNPLACLGSKGPVWQVITRVARAVSLACALVPSFVGPGCALNASDEMMDTVKSIDNAPIRPPSAGEACPSSFHVSAQIFSTATCVVRGSFLSTANNTPALCHRFTQSTETLGTGDQSLEFTRAGGSSARLSPGQRYCFADREISVGRSVRFVQKTQHRLFLLQQGYAPEPTSVMGRLQVDGGSSIFACIIPANELMDCN